ncbi:lysophospholipid acyltransferase family protein [Hamadaea tsunoensis]|uniref:lysophospholipid acyltransferase family protein n=1 Tax=Hamadaea tsunoensis TaxID=53368 RepID=UPI000482AD23|nr:lysophospholipid acyltransferase family protein [Hamadaea tsunoensis]
MLLQAGVRAFAVPLFRMVYRPRVEGREHVPRTGAVILAANHISALDSFVIPLVSPRPVAFMAKAEYFVRPGAKGWVTRTFLEGTDAIPISRTEIHTAQDSLDAARTVLTEGRAFGIHPEGSRSRDGRIHRGRTGVAWLALETGATVIPVGVIGTDRLQPVGSKLPRLGRVTVRFGEPLRFTPPDGVNPNKARRAVTDEIMAAIQGLSGQETASGYANLGG